MNSTEYAKLVHERGLEIHAARKAARQVGATSEMFSQTDTFTITGEQLYMLLRNDRIEQERKRQGEQQAKPTAWLCKECERGTIGANGEPKWCGYCGAKLTGAVAQPAASEEPSGHTPFVSDEPQLTAKPIRTWAREKLEARKAEDGLNAWIVAQLAAIIPRQDILNATRSGAAMVGYFRQLVREQEKAGKNAARQAEAAVCFVHEIAMGAYKRKEIDARAIEISRMAPLSGGAK